MVSQTMEKLTTLHLSEMCQEYRRQQELPATEALSFDDRLGMMVDAEWLARYNKKLKRLIKEADLRDSNACLEDVDYDPRRKLDKALVARLSDGMWIREHRNMLITGATGTGKSFLASAFGNMACRLGLRVRSFRITRLLTNLMVGRGDGSYSRLLDEMKKPDLLILDDFGLSPLSPTACRDLLEVVDDRYDRASLLITAQLPVSGWHGIFEDATIADAVLDRLVHNAYRFELDGPTRRMVLCDRGAGDRQN